MRDNSACMSSEATQPRDASEPRDHGGSLRAARSIEIALSRDGLRWALVDGAPAPPALESYFEAAIRELELSRRAHFEAFVARVEAAESGRWELTVDPL